MKKTFVEYKVKLEEMDAYRLYMADVLQRTDSVEWLESQEQPGLFLEIHANSEEGLAERRQADPNLLRWAQNGSVRVWTFFDAGQRPRN
ncbi:hypothetical protein DUZ99_00680 [Xylanibacillus composti]|uniref:Uncharacterized protein n=1 Tax=Xylanibacillus composti TaxID=1572762 RepID=A0A8J4H044_9BACL|nr:hypothetical protein [Xylanibacillus composti]MDT9723532.1 hypothetical protein [Xylanibacillus composti]GIQ68432.1 hypothetical protein XYCOK13_12560 [Xylanibacillus composti]